MLKYKKMFDFFCLKKKHEIARSLKIYWLRLSIPIKTWHGYMQMRNRGNNVSHDGNMHVGNWVYCRTEIGWDTPGDTKVEFLTLSLQQTYTIVPTV